MGVGVGLKDVLWPVEGGLLWAASGGLWWVKQLVGQWKKLGCGQVGLRGGFLVNYGGVFDLR